MRLQHAQPKRFSDRYLTFKRSLSASDPKQTCRKTQSTSLLRVKRTLAGAVQMSAFDPKRTSAPFPRAQLTRYDGPKRTFQIAMHMPAFGVKRTCLFALHMSAFGP